MDMPADISAHFSAVEVVTTAQRDLVPEQMRIWNGTLAIRTNAKRHAILMEKIRNVLGVPLHVNSWYRCPTLNARVGGVTNSRHMLALATDFVPIGMTLDDAMRRISSAVRRGELPELDKIIIECGAWIHVQSALDGTGPRLLCLKSEDGERFERYV